jgi:NADH-quinone oxidoreductase subunit N
LFSILLGTFSALRQNKIKRFLAFSSVTHMGFLLIAFSSGTLEGVGSLIFYMFVYIIMSLNIWCMVFFLESYQRRVRYLTDLQNLSKSNPILAFTLSMNLFSMAGVPPLAGFFAKMYVFFSGLEACLNLIVVVGIVMSVVSAFYYLRLIKLIYFDSSNSGFMLRNNVDFKIVYVLGLSLFLILFLFLNPGCLILFTESLGIFLFSS